MSYLARLHPPFKQAGGLKASPIHVWLGLALFSLFNNQ